MTALKEARACCCALMLIFAMPLCSIFHSAASRVVDDYGPGAIGTLKPSPTEGSLPVADGSAAARWADYYSNEPSTMSVPPCCT